MQRRVVKSSMVERRFRIVEESIVILVVGEGGGRKRERARRLSAN